MSSRTHLGITYTDDGAKLAHRGPGPKRELCIMACVFCRDPVFLKWIYSLGLGQVGVKSGEFNEAGAKAFILHLCQTDSRNKLDTDPAAGKRFLQLVRTPFLAWKEQAAT